MTRLIIFKSMVPECPNYNFSSSDVCQRRRKCVYIHPIPHRLSNHRNKLILPIECQCEHEFSFKCSKHFCTKHKRACTELITRLNLTSTRDFKDCQRQSKMITIKP